MTPEFFWMIVIQLIGCAIFLVVNTHNLSKWAGKLATKEELEKAKAEGDEKNGRVYSRLDEYKEFIEEKVENVKKEMKDDFVCRNVCKILHDQNDKNFERVEAKVDTLAAKFDEGLKEILKIVQEKKERRE